jgi:glycosyltransferase involved in cell wall biosynthesis
LKWGQILTTVSVIIPAYNQAQYLAAAIESALAQTYGDLEIIVVDDGSTDQTPTIAQQFGGAIHYLRQENRGLSRARNRGLEAAQGQFAAFLDSDDLWHPSYLDQVVAALKSSPRAVGAFAGWQYVDAKGTLLPQAIIPFGAKSSQLEQDLPWRCAVVPSGIVVRRQLVQECGGFDPQLSACEDWDLWLRLLPFGPFQGVPQVLVWYRTHGENMSDDIGRMEGERLRVHWKHFGLLEDAPSSWPPLARKAVGNTYFVSSLAYFRRAKISTGIEKIKQALEYWPKLIEQDEFFYELGCWYQQRGFRGTEVGLDIPQSEVLIRSILFSELRDLGDRNHANVWWGHGCLILSRLALRSGDNCAARRYASQAILHGRLNQKWASARALARSAWYCHMARAPHVREI